MRKQTMIVACLTISIIAIVIACNQPSSTSDSSTSSNTDSMSTSMKYGAYESQVKWGEHLVNICACNDCHTPKKWDQADLKMIALCCFQVILHKCLLLLLTVKH